MMASKAAVLSAEQVCNLLQDNGFDDSVVELFKENKIDGTELSSLDREDMKELKITALGDQKKLLRSLEDIHRSSICSREESLLAEIAGTPPCSSSSNASDDSMSDSFPSNCTNLAAYDEEQARSCTRKSSKH